ncbi:MAG: DUF4129 domain-containing protein [Comamonadaceae bacterium]|nr:MAG: DUF4129 domain-containing protein [Comamonadaceae bacterium]
MRSRRDALVALALSGGLVLGPTAPVTAAPLDRAQVQAAADRVRADPDLPGTHMVKSLRLKARDAEQPPETAKPDRTESGNWFQDFFSAASGGARVVVWVLGALAVAWIALRLRRWMGMHAGAGRVRRDALPSHVGTLDIRPESLPDDIGAAAASLWQRGQQRAALSLLYRGALSRLVHVQQVPIRAASTEGDCIALAERHLDAASQAFFMRLVSAWQLAAYGGRLPVTAGVLALCGEFEQQLPAPAPTRAEA